LARIDMTGDDLDELTLSVGELSRRTKLTDQDDLVACRVEGQHRRRPPGAQEVMRPHRMGSVRGSDPHSLITAETFAQHFPMRDDDFGPSIGDGAVPGVRGSTHRDIPTARPRPRSPSPD